MTFEKLKELIKKHNIPENVKLLNDSGLDIITEMNGVFYNKKLNHIIFTQFKNDIKYLLNKENYEVLNIDNKRRT